MAAVGVEALGVIALAAATLPTATAFLNHPEAPQAAVAAAPGAEPLVRGAIIDPSGSNGGAESAKQDFALLADVVADWSGPVPPDEGTSAYSGVPGLDLTVRCSMPDNAHRHRPAKKVQQQRPHPRLSRVPLLENPSPSRTPLNTSPRYRLNTLQAVSGQSAITPARV